jgi:hypothetical protein
MTWFTKVAVTFPPAPPSATPDRMLFVARTVVGPIFLLPREY